MCGAITPIPRTLSRLLCPALYRACHPQRSRHTGCWVQHPNWDVWHPALTSVSETLQLWSFQKRCASLTRNFRTAQSLESCSLGCQTDFHSHCNQRKSNLRDLHFETNLLVYLQEVLTLPHYLHSSSLWESKQSLLTSFWVCQIAIFLHFVT
jgi:hypothetical protein